MVAGRPTPNMKRVNILTLDGGGVRGLSSLLILDALMQEINLCIRASRPVDDSQPDVELCEIFELAAGTSTGGLIAVMLGKLGMSPKECIEEYRYLSQEIFGTKQFMAWFSFGLGTPKYSGSKLEECVRKLLERKGFSQNLLMTYNKDEDKVACAVVCREQYESKYSRLKPRAVCICSRLCQNGVSCLVCQAARATSAAFKFFPPQKIKGRCFVDGAMEFNNPSYVIFHHYSQVSKVAEARRASETPAAALRSPDHGGFDFSDARFINLGTGTGPDDSQRNRPGFVSKLMLPAFRMLASLKTTLKEIAVDSERVADFMKSLEQVSSTSGEGINVKYERFSADTGVGNLAMDRFKDIGVLETLTQAYLQKPMTRRKLRRVGEEIAKDYLHAADTNMHLTSLTVPVQKTLRPQMSSLQTPEKPHSSPNNHSSRSTSGAFSEMSIDNKTSSERSPSTQTTVDTTPERLETHKFPILEAASFATHGKTCSLHNS